MGTLRCLVHTPMSEVLKNTLIAELIYHLYMVNKDDYRRSGNTDVAPGGKHLRAAERSSSDSQL